MLCEARVCVPMPRPVLHTLLLLHVVQMLQHGKCLKALWDALVSVNGEVFQCAVQLLTVCLTSCGSCWRHGKLRNVSGLGALMQSGGTPFLASAMHRIAHAVVEQQSAPGYGTLCARIKGVDRPRVPSSRLDPRELAMLPELLGQKMLACVHLAAEADVALHTLHCRARLQRGGTPALRRALEHLTRPGWHTTSLELVHASLDDPSRPPWPTELLYAHQHLLSTVRLPCIIYSSLCTCASTC